MTLIRAALLWDEWNDNAYCLSDSMTPEQMKKAQAVIDSLSSEEYSAMMECVREIDRRKQAYLGQVSEALIRFDDATARRGNELHAHRKHSQ